MTTAKLIENKTHNIDLVLSSKKTMTPLVEADIYDLIAKSEYTHLQVDKTNIKNAIAELNDVLKPLQINQTGREICYQILERIDADIKVTIGDDDMAAFAEIVTAYGGKHLSAKEILNAAQTSGVKKGFSKEELIKLAQLAMKEAPGSIVKLQIATGKLPTDGKDAHIKRLVETAQERILKPKARDDGSVDMRDLGDIVCVKNGDSLAQKIPLTQGIQGFTVAGKPLNPNPGNDIDIKSGDGTTFSPKDSNLLLSTRVGLPRIIDNGMEVDEVYQINSVDVSTGNIKFEGAVIIKGDVCEGMKVIASGDITIGGFVESAYVEAGGDITISGGIIGRKYDLDNVSVTDCQMSAKIAAAGSIFAKYCQYAEIKCHGDLRIQNQLMHSIIDTDRTVWVGSEDKANGKLIGGFLNVGQSVHAGIIGATAGSHTFIKFDKTILAIKELLVDVDARLKAESDKADELLAATNKLKKLPKEQQNKVLIDKVIKTYQFHAKNMAKVLEEKQAFEDEIQRYMTYVFVEATEKLYQGVDMSVGEFNERSRREYGPSKMIYKERKVHIEPLINT